MQKNSPIKIGPFRTLIDFARCCGAARQSGHSFKVQHFPRFIATVRDYALFHGRRTKVGFRGFPRFLLSARLIKNIRSEWPIAGTRESYPRRVAESANRSSLSTI